jgi:hypothetical protein
VLEGAREHLAPRGRILFSIFAFLGRERALARLKTLGFEPSIVAREVQGFPRIGYERLDHLRSVDAERTIPADALPETVERFIVQGRLAGRAGSSSTPTTSAARIRSIRPSSGHIAKASSPRPA